jgi:hypothetical protein
MVCFVLSLGSQSKRDDGLKPCAVVLEKANHRAYRLRYACGLLWEQDSGHVEEKREWIVDLQVMIGRLEDGRSLREIGLGRETPHAFPHDCVYL